MESLGNHMESLGKARFCNFQFFTEIQDGRFSKIHNKKYIFRTRNSLLKTCAPSFLCSSLIIFITFCPKDSGRNRATDLCNNSILQYQIGGALKIVHDWWLSIIFDILAFFGPELAITMFCCLCIQNYKLSSHNKTSHNCCHVSPHPHLYNNILSNVCHILFS